MFLPYQFRQKFHSPIDLFRGGLAVGSPDIVASLSGICHESMSRHEGDVFLLTSRHQHIVNIANTSHLDPDEHTPFGNGPIAQAFQVTFHGSEGAVSARTVVLPHGAHVCQVLFDAPELKEGVDQHLKKKTVV